MDLEDLEELKADVEKLKSNLHVIDGYIDTLGDLSGLYGKFMPERDYVRDLMNDTYELVEVHISGINANIEDATQKSHIYLDHNIIDAKDLVKTSKVTIEKNCNEIVNKSVCTVIGTDLDVVYSLVNTVPKYKALNHVSLMSDEKEFYETIADNKKFIEIESNIDYSSISERPAELYKNFKAILNLHKETYDFIKNMEMGLFGKGMLLQKIMLMHNAHTKLLKKEYNRTVTTSESLLQIHPPKDYLSFTESSMREAMEVLPDGYSEIKTNWSDKNYVGEDVIVTLKALHDELMDDDENTEEIVERIYAFREQFKDSEDLQRYIGKILFLKELDIRNKDSNAIDIALINLPNSKDFSEKSWETGFHYTLLGAIDGLYDVLENPDDYKSFSELGVESLVKPFLLYTKMNNDGIIPEDDISHKKIIRIDEELNNRFGDLLKYDYNFSEFYIEHSSFDNEGVKEFLDMNPKVRETFDYKEKEPEYDTLEDSTKEPEEIINEPVKHSKKFEKSVKKCEKNIKRLQELAE